jgi:hypothetical protein
LASQAAGSSGGGAGRGGKERATRCVGQRSSGQSATPRGARAGGGAGGRAESAPRGGVEGGRAGGGSRTVWCPRRAGAAGVGRACHSRRKVRPRVVPANFAQGPVPRAMGARGPRWASRETGLGRPAAPLAGRLPGVRGWSRRFSNLSSHPAVPDGGKPWHFVQTVPIADFLKTYNFLFSFLFSPAFSLNKM